MVIEEEEDEESTLEELDEVVVTVVLVAVVGVSGSVAGERGVVVGVRVVEFREDGRLRKEGRRSEPVSANLEGAGRGQ